MEKGMVVGAPDSSITMRSQIVAKTRPTPTQERVGGWQEEQHTPDQPPASAHNSVQPYHVADTPAIPHYLQQTYWWAYIHPKGVRFFERQWLVNLILWGNFSRLRDVALAEIGQQISGNNLQVACVYGDFTACVTDRLTEGAHLDVMDVAPVQLENLRRKLNAHRNQNQPSITLHHQDSTQMKFKDDTYDNVIVFFLLHEQPDDVRKKTVQEAIRVVKPGGKVIFVDYHKPSWFNPFRYVMLPILHFLEPFALDLWKKEIISWVPKNLFRCDSPGNRCHKETFFGGLYQKVVFKPGAPQQSPHGIETDHKQ